MGVHRRRGGGVWLWQLREHVDPAHPAGGGLNGDGSQLPLPDENSAYQSQEPHAGFRPPKFDGVKTAELHGDLDGPPVTDDELRQYMGQPR